MLVATALDCRVRSFRNWKRERERERERESNSFSASCFTAHQSSELFQEYETIRVVSSAAGNGDQLSLFFSSSSILAVIIQE